MAAEATEAANVTPETAWRNLGGLRGLDAPALAAAIDLAAWRQRTCIELDRPLGQVMTDKALLDLARQRPTSLAAIRSTKGVSTTARHRATEIAAVIEAIHPDAVAPIAAGRPLSPRAQRWTEVLLAIVHLVADQSGVPPRLLATRGDAEELARAIDERGPDAIEALPAMSTWRRDVLGTVWARWLGGKLALVGDLAAPHGFRLVPP
jgi:ribonuclease D